MHAEATTLPRQYPDRVHERRAYLRRMGSPVPVSIRTEVLAEPLAGEVLDRSDGGLRLAVDRQISAGMILRVSPAQALGFDVWVDVQVVYCLSWDSRWVVGCQFVNTPSPDVRTLFG
jgi:hypothetical protein